MIVVQQALSLKNSPKAVLLNCRSVDKMAKQILHGSPTGQYHIQLLT
jgi:hypothetical protein